MKFRTTIKLVSEAHDKNEALDLVEEYLSGNIMSGIDMRCVTKPVCSGAKIVSLSVISLVIIAGIVLGSYIKHPQIMMRTIPGVSAVQPPLKTSGAARMSPEFMKEWQDRQTKEALSQITK